nr:hypothetical protein [Clostridium sp. 1001271B_151109_B4]
MIIRRYETSYCKELVELFYNTYEQGKVFEFLKNVLMSNVISNSVNEEIAENRFNKGKCCLFCNHDKISI